MHTGHECYLFLLSKEGLRSEGELLLQYVLYTVGNIYHTRRSDQLNMFNQPSSSVQECVHHTCNPGRLADSHSWRWFLRWPIWGLLRYFGPKLWPSASDQSPGAGRCSWAVKDPSFWGFLSPGNILIKQIKPNVNEHPEEFIIRGGKMH